MLYVFHCSEGSIKAKYEVYLIVIFIPSETTLQPQSTQESQTTQQTQATQQSQTPRQPSQQNTTGTSTHAGLLRALQVR